MKQKMCKTNRWVSYIFVVGWSHIVKKGIYIYCRIIHKLMLEEGRKNYVTPSP